MSSPALPGPLPFCSVSSLQFRLTALLRMSPLTSQTPDFPPQRLQADVSGLLGIAPCGVHGVAHRHRLSSQRSSHKPQHLVI